jgi:hypothetical protein
MEPEARYGVEMPPPTGATQPDAEVEAPEAEEPVDCSEEEDEDEESVDCSAAAGAAGR